MADLTKIVSATIAIAVSVIVIASVLAPTVAEYVADGAALEQYAGLLGAVIVMTIVGVLMVAVKLIANKN